LCCVTRHILTYTPVINLYRKALLHIMTHDVVSLVCRLKECVDAAHAALVPQPDPAVLEPDDYAVLEALLNSPEETVVVPPRRFLLHRQLTMTAYNKRVYFARGAVVIATQDTRTEAALVVRGSAVKFTGLALGCNGVAVDATACVGWKLTRGVIVGRVVAAKATVRKTVVIAQGNKKAGISGCVDVGNVHFVTQCSLLDARCDLFEGIDVHRWVPKHAMIRYRLDTDYEALYALSTGAVDMLFDMSTGKTYTQAMQRLYAHVAGVVTAGALTDARLAILRLPEKDDFKLAALCAYTDALNAEDLSRRFGHVRKHALPLAIARATRKRAKEDGCTTVDWTKAMEFYLQCHLKWDSTTDNHMIKRAHAKWRQLITRLMAAVALFPDLPADTEARERYMDELAKQLDGDVDG
jgi:hypothetical protein